MSDRLNVGVKIVQEDQYTVIYATGDNGVQVRIASIEYLSERVVAVRQSAVQRFSLDGEPMGDGFGNEW